MSKSPARRKVMIVFVVNLLILGMAVYVEEFRQLHPSVQLTILVVLAGFQSRTGPVYDYFREKTANIKLTAETEELKLSNTETHRELDELKQVVVSFLEHSEIYRERVKDQLRLQEDYLCIAKSSEGLSSVWRVLKETAMMPFGAVLMRIPGTVKPFENMTLYFVPVANMPGINEWNIREYITREIIPEVKSERRRFLRRPRKKDPDTKPDKFSYKYMAFLMRKGSIAYEMRNRKFNREFNAFIVDEQTGGSYRKIKNELTRFVKTKELLALANWASFAKLNRAQRAFVENNRHLMSAELAERDIGNLSDIAGLTPEELLETLWPVFRHRISRIKALNICKKVTKGARHTVEVLERSGVRL